MRIEIDLTGLTEAASQFEQLANRAANIAPAGTAIALAFQADVDERFASAPNTNSGGEVFGGATWPKLSQAYLNQRPDRRGGQILRDTGELLNSYQVGTSDNIFSVTPNSVTFGSALPKARYLAGRFPQIIIHPQLVESIERVLIAYLAEGVT